MPPRKKASPKKDASSSAKPAAATKPSGSSAGAKRARAAGGNEKKKRAGPYKMPPPLPKGETLTDFRKNKWVLGTSVGKGGFGEIYTARPSGKSTKSAQYVIKIEPHENGPLFTELSFYTRIAKPERILSWVKDHGLSYLAVPKFIASGSHDHARTKFRFMVMDRFGEDIEKKFTAAGRRFSLPTVCYLALKLLDALEFLHESEYVHADVKGSNLLTGFGAGRSHEVYLVDYGLAYRYNPDGKHKEYKEDPRRAHDGTIEFTSIDAHKGVSPSRRADLEILGYCLLQWACGRLPWEDNLQDKAKVAAMKIKYHGDAVGLLKACFGDVCPPSSLRAYMDAVYRLDYTDRPDYHKLKDLFTKELKALGCHGDGKDSLDWITSGKPKAKATEKASPKRKARPKKEVIEIDEGGSERESEVEEPPPKRKKRAVKTKPADVDEGSGNDDEVTPIAPPPARKKKGTVADGGEKEEVSGKRGHISQKRPANKKGKAKDKMAVSESAPAMVYYPKELGYAAANGEDDSTSDGGGSEVSEEEEEWRPAGKKIVGGRKRRVAESSSEEEWSPVKRKRVAKTTKAKPKRTATKRKS